MSSSELIGTRAAQPLDDLLAFASLPETVRELVAASFRREVHAFGDEVVRRGMRRAGCMSWPPADSARSGRSTARSTRSVC